MKIIVFRIFVHMLQHIKWRSYCTRNAQEIRSKLNCLQADYATVFVKLISSVLW